MGFMGMADGGRIKVSGLSTIYEVGGEEKQCKYAAMEDCVCFKSEKKTNDS